MRRAITILLLPADADELQQRLGCHDDAELADAIRIHLEAKLFRYRHVPPLSEGVTDMEVDLARTEAP